MRFREGDFIKTFQGLIFDVKGLIHPPERVIAFPRYVSTGKRNEDGICGKFIKIYSLSKRYKLLQKRFPQYLIHDTVLDETVCEVPRKDITEHYEPVKKLRAIAVLEHADPKQKRTVLMAMSLKDKAHVDWCSMGVSGSLLVDLHTTRSDIDLVIYGVKNAFDVQSVLEEALNEEVMGFRRYSHGELRELFEFRSRDSGGKFGDFVRTESRKVFQGKFNGTDYFIRFIKNWDEINEEYGDVQCTNVGEARIAGEIADDSDSIFTPCSYDLGNVRTIEGWRKESISQIASFRGRFCGQAKKGETVVSQGKVEHVVDTRNRREYNRLLIGNKASDFMVLRG